METKKEILYLSVHDAYQASIKSEYWHRQKGNLELIVNFIVFFMMPLYVIPALMGYIFINSVSLLLYLSLLAVVAHLFTVFCDVKIKKHVEDYAFNLDNIIKVVPDLSALLLDRALASEKPSPVISKIFKSHVSYFLNSPKKYKKTIQERVKYALYNLHKLDDHDLEKNKQ